MTGDKRKRKRSSRSASLSPSRSLPDALRRPSGQQPTSNPATVTADANATSGSPDPVSKPKPAVDIFSAEELGPVTMDESLEAWFKKEVARRAKEQLDVHVPPGARVPLLQQLTVLDQIKKTLKQEMPRTVSENIIFEAVNRAFDEHGEIPREAPATVPAGAVSSATVPPTTIPTGLYDDDDDDDSEFSDPPEDLLELFELEDTSLDYKDYDDIAEVDRMAAIRIARHLNTRNGSAFQARDFFDTGGNFTVENVLKILGETDYDFDGDIIRGIMHDRLGEGAGRPTAVRTGEKAFRHPIPPPSSHETRQSAKNQEWFEKKPGGGWLVIFEKKWTGADGKPRYYRQEDDLPSYVNDAPALKLFWDEKDAYIQYSEHLKIPTFHKADKGQWVVDKENKAKHKWKRNYDNPPRDAGRVGIEAEPKFIIRKYHRQTDAYLDRYKIGQTWDDWERIVEGFEINNVAHARAYSRWVHQVVARQDYARSKRKIRPCWSKEEIGALRRHFNDLINDHGLIKAHLFPYWKDVFRKVNEQLAAINDQEPPRHENAIAAMAERDIYINSNSRMGIAEWRALGKELQLLQQKYPDLTIPKNVLFPSKNPIPLDDVQAKAVSGQSNSQFWSARRDKTREPKIKAKVVDGKLVITDRFDGKLVRRYGLMDHLPEYSHEEGGAQQDPVSKDDAEEADGHQEDDGAQEVDTDEDEVRPRKKARRGKK